ncbi:MAG TPA: hypothetical protein VF002_01520 [Gaiellaceae bacterium]
MLKLVLDDHSDHEPLAEQGIAVVERKPGQQPEHGLANLLQVGARDLGRRHRQPAALAALVGECVVEIVVLR